MRLIPRPYRCTCTWIYRISWVNLFEQTDIFVYSRAPDTFRRVQQTTNQSRVSSIQVSRKKFPRFRSRPPPPTPLIRRGRLHVDEIRVSFPQNSRGAPMRSRITTTRSRDQHRNRDCQGMSFSQAGSLRRNGLVERSRCPAAGNTRLHLRHVGVTTLYRNGVMLIRERPTFFQLRSPLLFSIHLSSPFLFFSPINRWTLIQTSSHGRLETGRRERKFSL